MTLSEHIRERAQSQISSLCFHLKSLNKESEINTKQVKGRQ